ncbi:dihydroneopterin triphosphate diphosphatase [Aromatoleum diolicum]|uniref:Dihydroneopterin triphosphate diphosphatase n=1 Tax=Aromatoleum diolicum TaxID=75796 RepID=A0ABX1QEJ1_9RHOO|nr:dihydroneopterin triphosphate diphosphatase [Aromatoleum diolicum]
MTDTADFKQPVSVLVVLHTAALQILLLRRVSPAGFWQSVTGSLERGETLGQTALREIREETGIAAPPDRLLNWHRCNRFEIRAEWRKRYAPDVTHNVEHVFSLCIPEGQSIVLAPDEHDALLWLPPEAAAAKVFSWTNRDAILELPGHYLRSRASPA